MSNQEPDSYALYIAGRTAMDSGDLQIAVERFKESVRGMPHFKTLELLGDCLMRLGEPGEAIVFLAAAAGLARKQSKPRYLLAKCLVDLRRMNDAIEFLEQALELNPNYKAARELLLLLRTEESNPKSNNDDSEDIGDLQ